MSTIVDLVFFFNDTATTEIYTLSLHDALPISQSEDSPTHIAEALNLPVPISRRALHTRKDDYYGSEKRSEEHTSELQSRQYLVCRLLLEKKKTNTLPAIDTPEYLHDT